MTTRANDNKPTRRVVVAFEKRGPKGVPPLARPFTVEVGATTFTLRPAGCRRNGPAEVRLTYAAVYEAALMARARSAAAEKKRKRRARA